jgi:hypothetical protein
MPLKRHFFCAGCMALLKEYNDDFTLVSDVKFHSHDSQLQNHTQHFSSNRYFHYLMKALLKKDTEGSELLPIHSILLCCNLECESGAIAQAVKQQTPKVFIMCGMLH